MAQDSTRTNATLQTVRALPVTSLRRFTHFPKGPETPSEELRVMVDDLLNDLSNKFNAVASEITAKSKFSRPAAKAFSDDSLSVDDMSRRIDNLEASMRSQRLPTEDNNH